MKPACLVPLLAMLSFGTALAQDVQVFPIHGGSTGAVLTEKEMTSVERHLAYYYPQWAFEAAKEARGTPVIRRGQYEAIRLGGVTYILASFTSRYKEPVNLLAIYRMRSGKPAMVWRSRPWASNYYDLGFETQQVGNRRLVLVREGGMTADDYGVATIFSMKRTKKAVWLRDITPSFPPVSLTAPFAMRALYARDIRLTPVTSHSVILRASENDYELPTGETIRPTYLWKYDAGVERFQRMDAIAPGNFGRAD